MTRRVQRKGKKQSSRTRVRSTAGPPACKDMKWIPSYPLVAATVVTFGPVILGSEDGEGDIFTLPNVVVDFPTAGGKLDYDDDNLVVDANWNVSEFRDFGTYHSVTDLKWLDEEQEDVVARSKRTKRRAFRPYQSGKELANKMSSTLSTLLNPNRYNKRIRPGIGKGAVTVEINFFVNSIGPVDEMTQAFYLDCYFRQSWHDERLAFNATEDVTAVSLDWKILNQVWKPDTFFVNGKKSKLHKITVPNRFSRLSPDGQVSLSQRLTIHAKCDMNLKKFPLDSQVCPLLIGSFGYPSEELVYKWKKVPIELADIQMSQFLFKGVEHGAVARKTNRKLESGFRNDSVAYLHFFFERQTGYFLLQIYTPLLLMVFCSWVGFWIIKTDVPGRAGLGITTVLSVTKIGFVGGATKPSVPYATALDIFVIICFVSVFASLIEFAVINFITMFITRYKNREKEEANRKEKEAAKEKATSQLIKELKKRLKKVKRVAPERVPVVITIPPDGEDKTDKDTCRPNGCNFGRRGDGGAAGAAPLAFIDDDDGGREVTPDGNLVANAVSAADDLKESSKSNETTSDIVGNSATSRAGANGGDDQEDRGVTGEKQPKRNVFRRLLEILRRTKYRLPSIGPVPEMFIYKDTEEACELIDSYSRSLFPLAFLFLMVIYWTTYLYLMEDILHV